MILNYNFNYSNLLGRIVSKFGSQYNFALSMGLSERTMSLKLNNKVGWKQIEIVKACELLHIEDIEIAHYFFDFTV